MNWTTIQTMIGYPLYDLVEEGWCLLSGYEDGIYGKYVKVTYLRGGMAVPFTEGRFEASKPVLPTPPVTPEEPDLENSIVPSNPENPNTGDWDDKPTIGNGNEGGNNESVE